VVLSVIGASFVVISFALLAHYIGLIRWTGEVMGHARRANEVLRNGALDDFAKEKAVQSAAVALFKLLGLLSLGSIIAVILPIAVVWLADVAGLLSFDAVMAMLIRWEFLLAATIVGTVVFFLLQRTNK
jgi:hypothetical protein